MRKSIKVMVLTAALPLPLLGNSSSANGATTLAGGVTGGGGISPGLTAVPTAQTFNFNGTLQLGVGAGIAIGATGTDLAGSVAEGFGFVNVTSPAVCSGVFVRVGAVVVVDAAGLHPCAAKGVFLFIPDQIGTPAPVGTTVVTSYTLTGAGAGVL